MHLNNPNTSHPVWPGIWTCVHAGNRAGTLHSRQCGQYC